MNCKSAELYMTALLDNELSVKDSIEIIEHLDSCKSCKSKWELNEETRSRLKHFFSLFKASANLRARVLNQAGSGKKNLYQKPIFKAASIAFLIGLGILISNGIFFSNMILTGSPSLVELQNKKTIGIAFLDSASISKKQLSAFKEANFKLTESKKMFNIPKRQSLTLLSLENTNKEKVSIFFLPANYKLPECHVVEKNGYTFHCGKEGNYNFAYWYQQGKTIALVSKNLSSEDMIDLALPIANEV